MSADILFPENGFAVWFDCQVEQLHHATVFDSRNRNANLILASHP